MRGNNPPSYALKDINFIHKNKDPELIHINENFDSINLGDFSSPLSKSDKQEDEKSIAKIVSNIPPNLVKTVRFESIIQNPSDKEKINTSEPIESYYDDLAMINNFSILNYHYNIACLNGPFKNRLYFLSTKVKHLFFIMLNYFRVILR